VDLLAVVEIAVVHKVVAEVLVTFKMDLVITMQLLLIGLKVALVVVVEVH
jgi:hypothetical protein